MVITKTTLNLVSADDLNVSKIGSVFTVTNIFTTKSTVKISPMSTCVQSQQNEELAAKIESFSEVGLLVLPTSLSARFFLKLSRVDTNFPATFPLAL
jgi:hypothetical protein